jgi:hypothetical protein
VGKGEKRARWKRGREKKRERGSGKKGDGGEGREDGRREKRGRMDVVRKGKRERGVKGSVSDPDLLIPDPDPAFRLNTDLGPDPIRIRGKKLGKIYS